MRRIWRDFYKQREFYDTAQASWLTFERNFVELYGYSEQFPHSLMFAYLMLYRLHPEDACRRENVEKYSSVGTNGLRREARSVES